MHIGPYNLEYYGVAFCLLHVNLPRALGDVLSRVYFMLTRHTSFFVVSVTRVPVFDEMLWSLNLISILQRKSRQHDTTPRLSIDEDRNNDRTSANAFGVHVSIIYRLYTATYWNKSNFFCKMSNFRYENITHKAHFNVYFFYIPV